MGEKKRKQEWYGVNASMMDRHERITEMHDARTKEVMCAFTANEQGWKGQYQVQQDWNPTMTDLLTSNFNILCDDGSIGYGVALHTSLNAKVTSCLPIHPCGWPVWSNIPIAEAVEHAIEWHLHLGCTESKKAA